MGISFLVRYPLWATALLVVVGSSLPTALAGQSTDGQSFPEATATALPNAPDLPIIGKVLGQTTEEFIGTSESFYYKRSPRRIDSWKILDPKFMRPRLTLEAFWEFDWPRCEWFVENRFGARAAGIHVSDGRVTRVMLFYPMLSKKNGEMLIAKFKKLGKIETRTFKDPLGKTALLGYDVSGKVSDYDVGVNLQWGAHRQSRHVCSFN